MLRKFKQFVDEINKENGRNYKISVLQKYKDDEDIKYLLKFIFDPYIVTGISKKKLAKRNLQSDCDISGIKGICEYLKDHNTGRDYDIAMINTSRAAEDEDLHDMFNAIVIKEVQLGVDTKTINKVIPGLIPEFNVQLACKYFEDPEKIEGKEFAITTKIDGGRIIAIKEDGKVTFYTRQGQVYEGLVDLEEEMKNYMPDNICLDGEITLLEPGTLTSKDQYKQTMKITRADGEKHGVKMLVFDCMRAEEFRRQQCNATYYDRRGCLDELFYGEDNEHSFKYFNVLPILYRGTNTSMIKKLLDEQIANGEEGVMLNVMDAKYEFERTWNLQKVKKMQTMDLEIVGYFEGNKQFTGMLGGFIVRYKDGNTVRVGSGFDKDLRIIAWNDPESYIGKIIEVQYFEETENANGCKSLRFPVFVDFRPDKAEADV